VKQEVREVLAEKYNYFKTEEKKLDQFLQKFELFSFSDLDRKIKHGEDLTFEEAFFGMIYVLGGTNRLFKEKFFEDFSEREVQILGTSFLQSMAVKEALKGLTPQEIAGMAGAVFHDLVIRIDFGKEVFEGCGMGGDKGFRKNKSKRVKTINVSTLVSVVLASLGIPVVKHGSYSNTSALGSTEMIEMCGANTNLISLEKIREIFRKTNFFYADAHWCKTVHDLSHFLRVETVNHIIGPLTPPIASRTAIYRLMGVNEKVHPALVAKAYEILNEKKFQKIENGAIVCGLDRKGEEIDIENLDEVKKHTILDELSPFRSVVAIILKGKFVGVFSLTPKDFGIEISASSIEVPNKKETIFRANLSALKGEDRNLAKFLAMNASLGLFVKEKLHLQDAIKKDGLNRDYLRECYEDCWKAIIEKKAYEILKKYVAFTKK